MLYNLCMFQSTDDGIDTTGEWNDSEEELFGSLKRGRTNMTGNCNSTQTTCRLRNITSNTDKNTHDKK